MTLFHVKKTNEWPILSCIQALPVPKWTEEIRVAQGSIPVRLKWSNFHHKPADKSLLAPHSWTFRDFQLLGLLAQQIQTGFQFTKVGIYFLSPGKQEMKKKPFYFVFSLHPDSAFIPDSGILSVTQLDPDY